MADKKTGKGKRHLYVVLDRTGSMEHTRDETVTGLDTFIKALEPDTRVSLAQFDSYVGEPTLQVVFEDKPAKAVKRYDDYAPRGSTPLLDAVGQAIARVESLKPKGKVVVLVVTDGYENASREWTRERVREAVKAARGKGWEFVFMGADIDAWGESDSLGMAGTSTMAYAATPDGTRAAYAAVATATVDFYDGNTASVLTPQEKVTGGQP